MLTATTRETTNIVTTINSSNNHNTNNHLNQSKETSFLRWLNPFNITNTNFNRTLRGSTPNLDSNNRITINTDKELTDDIEYRGVEGLKQFWNNRISLTKDLNKKKSSTLGNRTTTSSSSSTEQFNNKSNLILSNSIGCLVSRSYSNDSNSDNSNEFSSIKSENSNLKLNQNLCEEGHRKRDNFYKYKTAATKKRLSLDSDQEQQQQQQQQQPQPNLNQPKETEIKINTKNNKKLNSKINGTNFPLISSTAKGEKIHWAKREDIFINRKQKPQDKKNDINVENQPDSLFMHDKILNIEKLQTSPSIPSKIKANNNCLCKLTDKNYNTDEITKMAIKSTDKVKQKNSTENYHKTITTTATTATTPMINKKDKIPSYDKNDNKNLSILSNQFNSSTNTSMDSLTRKKTTNSSAVRRYSFRTHATKNFYSPRKVTVSHHHHHHNHHHQIVGSKVAALTMQFNQMVEKDSAILDEVKKKNGVLMARAGHVYKIKEETDKIKKKPAKRNASSESEEGSIASFKLSKKKITLKKKIDDGTVSARIRRFEGENNHLNNFNSKIYEKPKVPEKSEHVLMRTKDLQNRNIQKKSKPTTIDIHLEEIKEETKTPTVETKEIISQSEIDGKPSEIPKLITTETDVKEINESVVENDPDESQSKKNRYARIYEKFRFRSPFFTNKKLQEMRTPSPENLSEPDKKIKEAIDTVNKKLENLSKSVNDIRITQNDNTEPNPNIKPNQSFLFQCNTKKSQSPSTNDEEFSPDNLSINSTLIEAINIYTINKTQSMDESKFPSLQINNKSINETIGYAKIDKQKVNDNHHQNDNDNDNDEELYEPIGEHKTDNNIKPQKSFLYTQQKINYSESKSKNDQSNSKVQNQSNENCNIYQTVEEAKAEQKLLDDKIKFQNHKNIINDENDDDDDDDTYENYESVTEDFELLTYHQTEDGYEICDPPKPPSPRVSDVQRNTTDELPAIPEPKRIIQQQKIQNNYLIINDPLAIQPPQRPKKSPLLNRTKLPDIPLQTININSDQIETNDDDHDYDEENIYDTIKGSEMTINCYDFLNGKNSPKSLDTDSMVSNCYETINSVRRILNVRNCDSISTTSSDNKTNSLYGMPMNGNSSIPQTDGSSDNNSDDWVDISDGDDEGNKSKKQQFIVVRERTKCHRSPDWSKRVRDQRIQQQSHNYYDDDSDHYYEPLFPSSIEQNSEMPSTKQLNEESNNILTPSSNPDTNGKNYQKTTNPTANNHIHHHHHHHHHRNHHSAYSDDYDSFDTDEETDEEVKKHDSGVDISNAKLPDPPQPTNQVYAFVKKFKNFISNKKVSTSPKTQIDSKQYENTQFYVNPNEYQNTKILDKKPIKKKTPTIKSLAKKSINQDSSDPYENTEFHAPPKLLSPKTQVIDAKSSSPVIINNSSPNQQQQPTINSPAPNPSLKEQSNLISDELVNRRKSKSEKSFKSKLRKSLTGSHHNSTEIANSLNSTRSTFYISDSIDLDSGIFEKTVSPSVPCSVDDKQPEDTTVKQTDSQTEITSIIRPTQTRKSKRNLRSPDLIRRRTTIGIRPNNPPPPPPTDKKSSSVTQKPRSVTSWYAECGVFKANGTCDDSRGERNSNSSWYADAGLYQTSGASVASSSGSSGVSTGGEGCPGDDNNSHSMFLNEPLYQIYSAAKLESISRDMEDQDSADGYEEIGSHARKPQRPSALQLVGPKQGPSRTLWSEIPEVINSEILSTLTTNERRLQEAKFEVLTSEASYLKSLNLLRSHFMNNKHFRDSSILSPSDRKTLFAHIVPVHDCSDRLLSDLERCWQDNIMLLGLSKSIFKNAEKYFNVYISFCEHQGKMDRTLRRLKEQKGEFNQKLEILEHDPLCCGLNLHSFLMLPMQRITRLPLLIDAVFSKVKADDDEYDNWKMTLAILNKIVAQCNDAANRCEQTYEIERISRQIEFPTNIRSLAIAPVGVAVTGSKPRTLVKKGELVHLIWRGDDAKLTFGKKFSKCNVYAFLFTDLLILTKKKSDEQFVVFDYCPRSMLTISSGDTIPQLPTKDIIQAGKNLILMTLLENNEGKTIEMILSCPSVSDQQRWLETTAPPESELPGEKLYEQWDCPQVIVKHEYLATEPDILSLEAGDVVNVTRKLPDGWYQGERIRDGVSGWFPGSYTEEVNSAHVRSRNLKQRYRLLTFTASYLEMQKRK